MILRKPYAMLIKYFRLIHAILTLILLYVLFQTNSLHNFFVDYLNKSNNLRISVDPSITSVNIYLYIAVLISIFFFFIIFSLMVKKNKPVKYYIFSIIYYSIFMVVLFLANSGVLAIVQSRASLQTTRITRDIIGIFSYAQYVFIFVSLFRTIGFNIKKFDFENDLKDLKILEEDNEEFELGIDFDSNDIKTSFNRTIRIIKYFIQENKKMLVVLTSIVLVFGIIYIVLNVSVYNKIYVQKETFNYANMQIKVLSSYETDSSYDGKDISDGNTAYCIVKLEFINNTENDSSINLSNVELEVNGIKSYPVDTKSYKQFKDIGVGYSDSRITAKSKSNFIFAFKIAKEHRNKSKTLKMIRAIKTSSKGEEFVFTKVKLNPINCEKVDTVADSKLNQTLKISDELLGDYNISITEYTFVDSDTFEYKEDINNKEYTFSGIIVPDYSDYYGKKVLKLKTNIEKINVLNKSFADKLFGINTVIRYKKDGKEYVSPFVSRQISTFPENEYIYLEAYDKIIEIDSDEIYLDIIIRNNKYTYKLK